MNAVAIFENTFGKKEDIQTYIKFGICVLFLICLFSRVCVYLFPKDLWLDEGYLFEAINSSGFSELVCGQLKNQSAPFLFIIINKLIITYMGKVSYVIHIIPFICSLLSLVLMYIISNKIGNIFYIFSVMLLFSLCYTPIYYSGEFKQYSTEMLVALLLLADAIKNVTSDADNYSFLSLKNIIFYIFCILCSSTALLYLAGILLAQIIIVLRKSALKSLHINFFWNIFILGAFITGYYLLYLKTGNSVGMKNYWRPFMIPMDFGTIGKYFSDIGIKIFCGLFFGPPKFAIFIFIGLIGGSILLWRKRMELLLLLSLPVVVTMVANVFSYPPGDPGAVLPIRARLLLFLLPNGVLVAAWFYAWVFSRLAVLAMRLGNRTGQRSVCVRPLACVVVVGCLVFGSGVANASYLYGMGYKIQQLAGLVRAFLINSTPDSLNLIFSEAGPSYRYYAGLSGKKLPVEIKHWYWPDARLKSRLEHLPDNRRILILFSFSRNTNSLREIDVLFTAQGRIFIKIPDYNSCLYILPKK